jgi:ABC-type Zn uptake system ZnuABC Zn-binding protein ZnuA
MRPEVVGMRSVARGALALSVLLSLAVAAPVLAASPIVVATTTIVGDVVAQVGGEAIALTVLLPPGADPHAFEPTPQDVARVAEADLVFVNGGGLEAQLEPLLRGAAKRIVSVSEGVPFRPFGGDSGHAAEGVDPHVWLDPTNVDRWTEAIERTLIDIDPAGAEGYAARAAAYRQALAALDAWVVQEVAAIPPERRRIIADHAAFGYFAARYGFDQVGAIFPGGSPLAEPSARDLAALEDAIRSLGAPAVFVSTTVNPTLAERVAEDTGARLVFLYVGSLSAPGGPAASYLDLLRYDVRAIVDALRGAP